MERREGRKQTIGAVAAVVAVTAAAYANGLGNRFLWDDVTILETPAKGIFTILSGLLSSIVASGGRYYRPLVGLWYDIMHLFGSGPLPFHAGNIVLHILVAILAFLVARRLLNHVIPAAATTVATAIAILFSLHPVHSESVAWASGVTDPLYSLFFLLALWLYMRADETGKPGHRIAAAAIFFLSTLAKEPALVLPLVITAYDYCFIERREKPAIFFVKRQAPFYLVALLYLVLRYLAGGSMGAGEVSYGLLIEGKGTAVSALTTALTVPALFLKYLKTFLLPVNLSGYYQITPLASLSEPAAVAGLAATATFAAGAAVAARLNRPLFFALALFVLPLLPALKFTSTGSTLFADRYLYLPVLGALLALALLLRPLLANESRRRKLAAVTVAVTLFLGSETLARNIVWSSDLTLWEDALAKNPEAALPHFNYGHELKKAGRWQEAIRELETALRLNPRLADAHMILGNIYAEKGLTPTALTEYRAGIAIDPNHPLLRYNAGRASLASGNAPEAIQHLVKCIQSTPENAAAHNLLGMALKQLGRMQDAAMQFQAAVLLQPGNQMYLSNLADARRMTGWQ